MGLLSFAVDIPAIVVEDMPATPQMSTKDITSAKRDSSGFLDSSPSPSPYRTPDISLTPDTPSRGGRGGLRRNRRVSELSMLSTDLGYQYPYVQHLNLKFDLTCISSIEPSFSRDSHEVEEDPQQVLSSMQNSMWGGEWLQ